MTIGLLDSFPALEGPVRELSGIPGSPPSLRQPDGCLFAPRCPHAAAGCLTQRPALLQGQTPDRAVACFHPAGVAAEPSSPAFSPEK